LPAEAVKKGNAMSWDLGRRRTSFATQQARGVVGEQELAERAGLLALFFFQKVLSGKEKGSKTALLRLGESKHFGWTPSKKCGKNTSEKLLKISDFNLSEGVLETPTSRVLLLQSSNVRRM
jgi:hypothetical protein